MLRCYNLEHRSKGKSANYKLNLILLIIIDRNCILIIANLFRCLLKMCKMQQDSLQRISSVCQFKYNLSNPGRLSLFTVNRKIPCIRLAAYNTSKIDCAFKSLPDSNQTKFIILFRIFKVFRKNYLINRISFSI